MTEREFAIEVVSKLQREGHQALFAGGCVRDELLGLLPADHDIATSARPEQVQTLFRRTHTFGASFGVVEVLGPKDANGDWLKVQVATFRSDGTYSDGRRPDSVVFSSPEEDAARRDFTINGLFFDPISGKLKDFVGGEADLKAKVLRAIGHPEERFTEDKLRILRAVRMAARFELTVEPATLSAARRMADQIRVVSAERIAEELRKILKHPTRGRGVRLLDEFGLVQHILPEVTHDPAEWETGCSTLSRLEANANFEVAFAALLRGVETRAVTAACKRLRFSNDELELIVWLCENRLGLANAESQLRSQLYPLLAHRHMSILYQLHRAEQTHPASDEYVMKLLSKLPPEAFNPPLLLSGDDLKALGLKPGPKFKSWLDQIRTLQLDGVIKSRTDAEEKIREWARADSK